MFHKAILAVCFLCLCCTLRLSGAVKSSWEIPNSGSLPEDIEQEVLISRENVNDHLRVGENTQDQTSKKHKWESPPTPSPPSEIVSSSDYTHELNPTKTSTDIWSSPNDQAALHNWGSSDTRVFEHHQVRMTDEESASTEGPNHRPAVGKSVRANDLFDPATVDNGINEYEMQMQQFRIFKYIDFVLGMELAGEFIPFCHSNMFCLDTCPQTAQKKKEDISNDKSVVMEFVYHWDDVDYSTEYKGSDKCEKAGPKRSMCSCDKKCIIYGDCCPDMFFNCLNLNSTQEILRYINDTLTKSSSEARASGVDSQGSQKSENSTRYADIPTHGTGYSSCETVNQDEQGKVWLISRCPEDFSDPDIKSGCETPLPFYPPVTATVEGGDMSFKNFLCARCHGMTEEDLTLWSTELWCDRTLNQTVLKSLSIAELHDRIVNGYCEVSFFLPNDICPPRLCHPEARLTLNEELRVQKGVEAGTCSSTDFILCKTYLSVLSGIRNPHCARCLDTRRRKRGALDKCADFNFFRPGIGGIPLLLDITGKFGEKVSDSRTVYLCADDEVYDPFSQTCKKLLCASGYQAYRGQCVYTKDNHYVDINSQLYPDSWYKMEVSIILSINEFFCLVLRDLNNKFGRYSSFSLGRVSLDSVMGDSSNSLSELVSEIMFNASQEIFPCRESVMEELAAYNITSIELDFSLMTAIDMLTLEQIKTLMTDLFLWRATDSPSDNIKVTNMISPNRVCSTNNISPFPRTDFNIQEFEDVLYAVLSSTNERRHYYPLSTVGYEIKVHYENDAVVFSETIFVCEENSIFALANCSVVSYSLNQTFYNQSGLFVNVSGEFFKNSSFEIRGNEVFVCSNFSFVSETVPAKRNQAYTIVSWVFTCIAILFLLVMIVFYIVFPELRTLPGKLTASLAATMALTFLANLFTLVEFHNEYVCPVAGALSHLVTLAHFGWMSAIAVNMALTFGPHSMSQPKFANGNKMFLRYNLVIWGFSALIVMVSVILDALHPHTAAASMNQAPYNDNNETSSLSIILSSLSSSTNSSPSSVTTSSSSSSSSASSSKVADYPRYGYPFCTWFSGPLWTKLAFVIIPYACTFIVNVICFIITIVGINKSSKKAAKIGKKSEDRVQCIIYLKISTAMGFMWILSILVNYIEESQVLLYLYVVLVLLQGVFLFFAFMVNKRVLTLIMRKCTPQKAASIRTSNKTTESSVTVTNRL